MVLPEEFRSRADRLPEALAEARDATRRDRDVEVDLIRLELADQRGHRSQLDLVQVLLEPLRGDADRPDFGDLGDLLG